MYAIMTWVSTSLINLPDDALAAIAAQLTQREQVALGRLVLGRVRSGRKHSYFHASTEAVYQSLRAAAAAAVLSHVHSCSFKLSLQSGCYSKCLQELVHLRHLSLIVYHHGSDSSTIAAVVRSLPHLSALTSLQLVCPQQCAYLPLSVELASSFSGLSKLQHLTLRRICIAAVSTQSAAACMRQIAALPCLTALDAPELLSLVHPPDAVAALQAMRPVMHQLQALKLPANNLEGPAVAALLAKLVSPCQYGGRGDTCITSSSCNACTGTISNLRTLDLSGNHHIFAISGGKSDDSSGDSSSGEKDATQAAVQHGLAALVAAGSLTELILSDTEMAPDDLAAMFQGHIGQSYCSSSSSTAGHQLKRLDLNNNRLLATADPRRLGDSLRHLKALEYLDISWITLGPEGVEFVTQLTNLQLLVMSGTGSGPAAMAALQNRLPQLRCLELFDSLGTLDKW